jgi:hypothetical protein
MAALKDLTVIKCCVGDARPTNIIVDDPISTITTGNTYLFTVLTEPRTTDCYRVLIIKDTTSQVTATLDESYTSCEECLSGITTAVSVVDCVRGETYFIDINTFTTLPTIGDIYYLSVSIEGEIKSLGCVTISCFVTPRDGDFIYSLTSISDSYTGCTECLINNFATYQVNTCLDPFTSYYIEFPSGFDYTNYIVTFIDSFGDIQCGTVDSIQTTETTGTLISILGTNEEVSCDECLAISNEKRIITNCLTQEDEVVWGSVFYEGNEVSNLSTSDGCFEVGDLTESAVTISTFLDYNPQPDCQECIQCTGLYYTYSSCTNTGLINNFSFTSPNSLLGDGTYGPFTGTTTGNGVGSGFYVDIMSGVVTSVSLSNNGIRYSVDDTITINKDLFEGSLDLIITITDVVTTGVVFSYQYVQNPIGKTFYVPQLDDCVEITGIQDINDSFYPVLSFDVFESCSECELNADNSYIWLTRECGSGQNNIVVLNSNSFTTGDYVKVVRGTTEFQCHELISPYNPVTDNAIVSYISNTVTPFSDCTSCNSGTLIGASIVKCGGGGQQFVNIPIDIWNIMTYFDSQLVFVTQNYGQCYILLNTCPLEPNYTTITPVSTYYNCIQCTFDNTRFPRSANTETLICVICCDCGSTGSTITQVAPPHPVWTDGYGTEVTQMNMVTLGGNGLNN